MMRGMGNMQSMMKQMQKLQKEMESSQEYVNSLEFVGKSSQDFVEVVVNGKKEVLSVKIKPEVVDSEDVEMLEDLVLMAINDAIAQAEKRSNEVMGKFSKFLP